MTGRDGGVDYAARAELLNPSSVAHTEGHTYRVIELVGTSEKASRKQSIPRLTVPIRPSDI
jgi:hypothetical protein